MGSFSVVHWLIVAVAVLLLFGRGRISETMGDFGKGIQSFKRGMANDGIAGSERESLVSTELGHPLDEMPVIEENPKSKSASVAFSLISTRFRSLHQA